MLNSFEQLIKFTLFIERLEIVIATDVLLFDEDVWHCSLSSFFV